MNPSQILTFALVGQFKYQPGPPHQSAAWFALAVEYSGSQRKNEIQSGQSLFGIVRRR